MTEENSKNEYFVNPDGIKLFRQIYKPNNSHTKAVVFICHGLFEHCQSGYYKSIISPLNDIGCMIITHDHRGHGRSEGDRGMVYDIHSLTRDVLLDIDEIISQQQIDKDIPVFIYGHSMGGLISIFATLEKKSFFTGMCLEAPAICLSKLINKRIIFFGTIMDKIFPSLSLAKGDMSSVCRDPEVVKEIENDKLHINRGVPVRTSMSIVKAVQKLQPRIKEVETPFIIGHGDADKFCELEGSEYFMEHCSTIDKTLLKFPNARHRLRSETENVNVEFCTKIVNWINDRIKSH